ncbi:MAG: hypothetical protein AB7N76_29970 [Planctomycetota bacterium]
MDEQEAKAQRIQGAVEPLLAAGDQFLVSADEQGKVTVQAATGDERVKSVLSRTHPRFYGYLLAASERISAASGCGLILGYSLAAISLCFALEARAFHGLFPDDASTLRVLDALRSWWAYAIVAVGCLTLWTKHDGVLEDRCYQRERNELSEHLTREQLDVYETLGHLEGDEALSTLSKHMKRDPRLGTLSSV